MNRNSIDNIVGDMTEEQAQQHLLNIFRKACEAAGVPRPTADIELECARQVCTSVTETNYASQVVANSKEEFEQVAGMASHIRAMFRGMSGIDTILADIGGLDGLLGDFGDDGPTSH